MAQIRQNFRKTDQQEAIRQSENQSDACPYGYWIPEMISLPGILPHRTVTTKK